jgi:outer membrane protein assembly factor BamB
MSRLIMTLALVAFSGMGLVQVASPPPGVSPDARELAALANPRNSPLTGINIDNVADLKAQWRALHKSGHSPRAGNQAQPLVQDGVGLGDGKVFVGQPDAKRVALDQKAGKVAWCKQAEDPKRGYVIANAPQFYEGMVIPGFAGFNLGTRGRNQMPAFGSALSLQDREDLASHVLELVK